MQSPQHLFSDDVGIPVSGLAGRDGTIEKIHRYPRPFNSLSSPRNHVGPRDVSYSSFGCPGPVPLPFGYLRLVQAIDRQITVMKIKESESAECWLLYLFVCLTASVVGRTGPRHFRYCGSTPLPVRKADIVTGELWSIEGASFGSLFTDAFVPEFLLLVFLDMWKMLLHDWLLQLTSPAAYRSHENSPRLRQCCQLFTLCKFIRAIKVNYNLPILRINQRLYAGALCRSSTSLSPFYFCEQV